LTAPSFVAERVERARLHLSPRGLTRARSTRVNHEAPQELGLTPWLSLVVNADDEAPQEQELSTPFNPRLHLSPRAAGVDDEAPQEQEPSTPLNPRMHFSPRQAAGGVDDEAPQEQEAVVRDVAERGVAARAAAVARAAAMEAAEREGVAMEGVAKEGMAREPSTPFNPLAPGSVPSPVGARSRERGDDERLAGSAGCSRATQREQIATMMRRDSGADTRRCTDTHNTQPSASAEQQQRGRRQRVNKGVSNGWACGGVCEDRVNPDGHGGRPDLSSAPTPELGSFGAGACEGGQRESAPAGSMCCSGSCDVSISRRALAEGWESGSRDFATRAGLSAPTRAAATGRAASLQAEARSAARESSSLGEAARKALELGDLDGASSLADQAEAHAARARDRRREAKHLRAPEAAHPNGSGGADYGACASPRLEWPSAGSEGGGPGGRGSDAGAEPPGWPYGAVAAAGLVDPLSARSSYGEDSTQTWRL